MKRPSGGKSPQRVEHKAPNPQIPHHRTPGGKRAQHGGKRQGHAGKRG